MEDLGENIAILALRSTQYPILSLSEVNVTPILEMASKGDEEKDGFSCLSAMRH